MLKRITLFLISALFITACHSPVYNQTEDNIADVREKAIAARNKSNASARSMPSLLVKQGLYVDTSRIDIKRQPSWLRNNIIIRGDQLSFAYYSRAIVNGSGSHILTRYQSGLDPNAVATINYSGPVKGALDLLSSKTGYTYSVSGNTVYWQSLITRTFDIAFMPGSSDYFMGSSGGSGGGGGSSSSGGSSAASSGTAVTDGSSSEYSNLSGKLSIWKDLETSIKQMLSSEGRVIVSESTTSVTVRDKPSNVELIANYIKNLNNNLSKQILVKVQVLELTLHSDFNYGINWGLVANAFAHSQFFLDAQYGTPVALKSLTGAAIPSLGVQFDNPSSPTPVTYKALINALSQQGKVSIVTEPRVVCLNNQVSVVRIVQQEAYVASLQNTSLGSSSSGTASQNTVTSQITPGTLVTGLTLYLLPKILDGKIYMQVNADLSTKVSLVSFSAGANSVVQLPTVAQKHFNQRSVIGSGDTLILSGFKQVSNETGAMQLFYSQALGGKASTQRNVETIVLITPIVLHGSV